METVDYRNETRIQTLIQRIYKDPTSKLTFLIGEQTHQVNFIEILGKQKESPIKATDTHRYWLLVNYEQGRHHQLKIPHQLKHSIFFTMGPNAGYSNFEHDAKLASDFFHERSPGLKDRLLYSNEYLKNIFKGFHNVHFIYQGRQNLPFFYQDVMKFRQSFLFSLNRLGLTIHVNNRQLGVYDESDIPLRRMGRVSERTTCSLVHCGTGKEYYFGRILDLMEDKWNQSYGFSCKICPKDTIKSESGNFSCTPCPFETRASLDRTSCIELFPESHLSLKALSMQLALAESIATILFSTGILMIFIRRQNTPLIKSIDFELTVIHLISSIILPVTLFTLYAVRPRPLTCILRLCSFALFYIGNVSIVLVRYNRLFKAFFRLPIKVTKRETAVDGLQRYFYICCIILVSGLKLVVLLVYRPACVTITKSTLTFKKYLACNTTFHINVSMGFACILQTMCFVQAYRSRRLPDTFKDVWSLIYGSFIISISFAVMYPIQVSQKDPENAEVVHLIVILLNNFLLVAFSYVRRAYIAVFKPKKNSKRQVRSQITNFSALLMSNK